MHAAAHGALRTFEIRALAVTASQHYMRLRSIHDAFSQLGKVKPLVFMVDDNGSRLSGSRCG
jgi:hypothetical protein